MAEKGVRRQSGTGGVDTGSTPGGVPSLAGTGRWIPGCHRAEGGVQEGQNRAPGTETPAFAGSRGRESGCTGAGGGQKVGSRLPTF